MNHRIIFAKISHREISFPTRENNIYWPFYRFYLILVVCFASFRLSLFEKKCRENFVKVLYFAQTFGSEVRTKYKFLRMKFEQNTKKV